MDYTKLSKEDKAYVIANIKSFPLSAGLNIQFNRDKMYCGITEDDINKAKDISEKCQKTAMDILLTVQGVAATSIEFNTIKDFTKRVQTSQTYSIENFKDLFVSFCTIVYSLQKTMQSPVNLNDYIRFMLGTYFPYKLKAYEIENYDNELGIKNMASLITYLLLLVTYNHDTPIHTSVSLHLITKFLGIDNKIYLEAVTKALCTFAVVQYDAVINNMNLLASGELDLTASINEIKQSNNMPHVINNNIDFNQMIIQNYNKDIVADKFKQGVLAFGDNIFGPEEDLRYLYVQMDKLDADEISRYLPLGTKFSFNISTRCSGFIRTHSDAKLCKIMLPDTTTRTLINKDGVNYVLFECTDDHNLRGLSFPAEYDESRKMIIIEISDKLDYDVATV